MAVLVAGSVGAACGVHALLRRSVPYAKLVEHNDVAGFMIAIVGVLYAVLMAFVVVAVWQQYNDSDSNYGSEVAAAADVFSYARSLQPEAERAIRFQVERYLTEMIDDEWPAMRSAHSSSAADATLARLFSAISDVRARSVVEAQARDHLQGSIERLFDLRNRRLSDNVESLPPVLWAALFAGAAITVGFGYLFGVSNFRIQLIMTGAVAALIAIMFTLLIELDFPFRRDTALSPARWMHLRVDLRTTLGSVVPAAPVGSRR